MAILSDQFGNYSELAFWCYTLLEWVSQLRVLNEKCYYTRHNVQGPLHDQSSVFLHHETYSPMASLRLILKTCWENLIMCVSVCMCVSMKIWLQVPAKAGRGSLIPRSWSYKWLWVTQYGHWNELRFSAEIVYTLNHWVIFPESKYHLWKLFFLSF